MKCNICGPGQEVTAPAVAIVVGGGDLREPLNLSPSQELRCCMGGKCDALFVLVNKGILAFTGREQRWRWARIVFADGHGVGLRVQGSQVEASA